jgi:hypothetical protein
MWEMRLMNPIENRPATRRLGGDREAFTRLAKLKFDVGNRRFTCKNRRRGPAHHKPGRE